MPKLEISVRHRLPRDEAIRRIKSLLVDLEEEHGDNIAKMQEAWSGNIGQFSFEAMGFAVSGTLEVTSSEVKLNGQLPFAASFFKGRIESAIRERAQRLLT